MAFHFHPPLHTNRAFRGAETVAFGYPARALVFEQRVDIGPLAIRDMRRRLTASDGLALLNRALDFRSDLVRMAEMFFRCREPQSS